jgi:chemotaxis protein MotB
MATKEKAEKKDDPPDDDDEEVEEEPDEGIPPWVMTFADLVTLLMVFFILLFAMGSIEDEKWRLIKESLKTALGDDVIPEAGTRLGLEVVEQALAEKAVIAVDEVGAMVAKEIEDLASEVEEFVYKNKLAGQVQVSSDERGAIITVSDVVLFPAGQAATSPAGKEVLKKVFDLLKQFDYNVKVEGHTDNIPIKTEQYPSNWELSAARAANVARQLVTAGFPPQKLSVEGFAEFRPKVPNDSTKNRGVNRRIEIVYQRGSIKKRMVDILRSQKTVVR